MESEPLGCKDRWIQFCKVSLAFRRKHAYLAIAAAVLLHLCYGIVYAFSVWTPVLKKAGWTDLQTQLVFSAAFWTLNHVSILGGFAMRRFGPRIVTLMGGCFLGLGFLSGSLIGATKTSFVPLLLTLGFVVGIGAGLGYPIPLACAMGLYPKLKGLLSGLIVAGFGLGSMIWIKLADEWGHLLKHHGFSGTLRIYGFLLGGIVIAASSLLVAAPKRGVESQAAESKTAPASGDASINDDARQGPAPLFSQARQAPLLQEKKEEEENVPLLSAARPLQLSPSRMLRTWQFYLVFLAMTLNVVSGVLAIGMMKLFPVRQLVQYSKLSHKSASTIASTAMAVFFAVGNALGRILWGLVADKFGPKRPLLLLCLLQAALVPLFVLFSRARWSLYLGSALIALQYGGNFSLYPSLTSYLFGNDHVGQNYPFVLLGCGYSGIIGPLLGGALSDAHRADIAFYIAGGLSVVGFGLVLVQRPPKRIPGVRAQVQPV